MGGCATKPKVLKDDDEKPLSPPPVPPPLKVQREAEKDVAVAPVDSPTKNLSLGNLFDKESEGARSGTENVNASDSTFEAISQEAGTSKSMEKPSPKVIEKENTESLEKLAAPNAADASTEKIASQDSVIIHEDYTDALEKVAVLTEHIKQTEDPEKSAEEVLEMTPTPDIVPTEKIASQVSVIVPDEYTDALEKLPAAVVRVADVPVTVAVENTNAGENTKQIEEEKPAAAEAIENLKQTEEVKLAVVHDQIQNKPEENIHVNTEDKKTVEENVKKQIEVVESINSTQESDVVPVEIK